MKRLHLHVGVDDLARAVGFYSGLFETRPCCAGSTYANWRVDDPPVNFAASVGRRPRGPVHLGLEVENPVELRAVDRVLHSPIGSSKTIPWEVAVRKPTVRKEPAS
jgi:hypothetical protein